MIEKFWPRRVELGVGRGPINSGNRLRQIELIWVMEQVVLRRQAYMSDEALVYL